MTITKKLLAILLSVVMLLSVVPFTASAATTYDSDYVSASELEEGDILAPGLNEVMLSNYTLILQAGTYGYEDEETYEMQRANTDLVLQQSGDLDVRLENSPEGLRVSVADFNEWEFYDYYPFDANGQTDRWVVVAIYDGPGNEPGSWVSSITLAGASAPVVYYNATFGASLIDDAAVKSVALSGDCFDDADTAQASTYAFHKNSGGNVEFTVMLETRNFDPTALIVTKGASTLPVYGSWGESYYYNCVFFSKIIDSQTGDITGYRYYLEANDDISIGYTSTSVGSFADLKNSATVVHFNDMDWYIIADHSTSAAEGSVTLLAKECIGSGSDQWKTAYANSDIQASLDALTASGGAFEGVADAILSVNLADVNVTGAKLYLPSAKELEAMRTDVLKCAQATGSQLNWWWLRSTAPNGNWQAVDADAGRIVGMPGADRTYGVRPALQLDLSKVEFDSETNTFALSAATPIASVNGVNYTSFADAAAASHAANEAVITPLVNLNELEQPVYTMTPGEVLNVEYVTVGGTMYNVMPAVSDPDYYVTYTTSASGGKYIFHVTTVKYAVKYTNGATTTRVNKFYGNYSGTQQALKDFTQSDRVAFKSLTSTYNAVIDLGGKTVTFTSAANDARSFYVGIGSTITVRNGKILFTTDDGFFVDGGTLNIESTATVEATGTHSPIIVKGNANGNTIVNVEGTVKAANSFAIAGNGNADNGGYTINIKDGADVSSNTIAIYHPNTGNLNISGGTVTGATAVYTKSGTTTITGGTLAATGAQADYQYTGSGARSTGDALVIDNCGFPGGAPSVSIEGGRLSSASGKAVASYVKQDDAAQTGSFERVDEIIPADSQAVFSSDVTALAALGYKTAYDEVKGGYAVEKIIANNGQNLTVEDVISQNVYIDIDAYTAVDKREAVLRIYRNKNADISETPDWGYEEISLEEGTAYESIDQYDGTYKFAFQVAPAQMSEQITVELLDKHDGNVIDTLQTSAADLCKQGVNSSDTAYANLCKAMLDYARACQFAFNYNMDNLVINAYYNTDITNDSFMDLDRPQGGTFGGVSCNGLNITAVSAFQWNFFTSSVVTQQKCTVVTGDNTDAYAISRPINDKDCIRVKGVEPANFGKLVDVVTADGTIRLSVYNVCNSILNLSHDANVQALARAVYFYGVAAAAYFG